MDFGLDNMIKYDLYTFFCLLNFFRYLCYNKNYLFNFIIIS